MSHEARGEWVEVESLTASSPYGDMPSPETWSGASRLLADDEWQMDGKKNDHVRSWDSMQLSGTSSGDRTAGPFLSTRVVCPEGGNPQCGGGYHRLYPQVCHSTTQSDVGGWPSPDEETSPSSLWG